MKIPTRYENTRFVLRPYEEDDGAAFFEAVDESRKELGEWIPWVAACQNILEATVTCRSHRADYEDQKEFRLMILRDGVCLGGTAFLLRGTPIDWRTGEIGMWIRTGCAGQGLATEVLGAMIEWGFGEWGWQKLQWKCDTRNIGSIRVAEKCGFIREGHHRLDYVGENGQRNDSYVYGLLPTDPR